MVKWKALHLHIHQTRLDANPATWEIHSPQIKNFAHKGMIIIPGNLSDAERTCGTTNCHPGIPQRINNSLMNTMSGAVSVNRFAFDELKKPARTI